MADEMDFKIDDEFANLMSKTSSICDDGMRSWLKEDGLLHPLLVWDEANVLLDGHRRLRLCKELGIPIRVERISLPDRDAAKKKMIQIQITRRNESDHRQALLEAQVHRDLVGSGMGKEAAKEKIAKERGVSTRTVYRNVQYGEAFDTLSDEWKALIMKHQLSRKVVTEIGGLTKPNKKALLERLKKYGKKAITVWQADREERRRKIERKRAERARGVVPSVADLDVTPEVKSMKKPDRIEALILETEKLVSASGRAAFKLFGPDGISDPVSPTKKRMDRAHAILVECLGEIRRRYVS